jgi:DNA primase
MPESSKKESMPYIPNHIAEQIKAAADILDVASEFVDLKKAGANYVGLSPFQKENTPSFNVVVAKNIFKDFSSGKGGDVIEFLKHDRLDGGKGMEYYEALEWLAKRYAIEIPSNKAKDPEKDELREANNFAQLYFRLVLFERDEYSLADRYLTQERKFPKEIIEKFQIGYTIRGLYDGLLDYAKLKNFSTDKLKKAGLLKQSSKGKLYDFFRGRIMFPIHDEAGNVIAFSARKFDRNEWPEQEPGSVSKRGNVPSWDSLSPQEQERRKKAREEEDKKLAEQPKYINSPDSKIFKKKYVLYGIHLAKKAIKEKNNVFLVEGYTDVMALHMAGYTNTVASLGTAVTPEHATVLRSITDTITFMMDSDAAGIKGVLRSVEFFLSGGFKVKIIMLSGAKDPDSYRTANGTHALNRYVETAAQDIIMFMMNHHMAKADVTDPHSIAKVIKGVVWMIAKIKDKIVRENYIKMCSQKMGVTELSLMEEMEQQYEAQKKGIPIFKKQAFSAVTQLPAIETRPAGEKRKELVQELAAQPAEQGERKQAEKKQVVAPPSIDIIEDVARKLIKMLFKLDPDIRTEILAQSIGMQIPTKWISVWKAFKEDPTINIQQVHEKVKLSEADLAYFTLSNSETQDQLADLAPSEGEKAMGGHPVTRLLLNLRLKKVREMIDLSNQNKNNNSSEQQRDARMKAHLELKKIERSLTATLKESITSRVR